MQTFKMPVMRIVNESFNLELIKKRYEGDPAVLEQMEISAVNFIVGADQLAIEFVYNGIIGKVQFPTTVNKHNPLYPDTISWIIILQLLAIFPDKIKTLEEIMFIIADETFLANNMYEKQNN